MKKIDSILKEWTLKVTKETEMMVVGEPNYSEYYILADSLNSSSVVYSFGIGEDLSFSNKIIEKYGCHVFAFDPTPKAINYVNNHDLSKNCLFHFIPIGVANYDGMTKFHLPTNDDYVSGSIEKWQGLKEESILVQVLKLNSIMTELGHNRIDLLKMDIEGTEFNVCEDIVKSGIEINQICVEIHDRFFEDGYKRLKKMIWELNKVGYYLASRKGDDLTFVKLR